MAQAEKKFESEDYDRSPNPLPSIENLEVGNKYYVMYGQNFHEFGVLIFKGFSTKNQPDGTVDQFADFESLDGIRVFYKRNDANKKFYLAIPPGTLGEKKYTAAQAGKRRKSKKSKRRHSKKTSNRKH